MRKVESPEYSPGQRADRRALAEITDLIDAGEYEAASVMAWEVQRDTPGDPAIWLLLTRIDYLRERHAAAMYAARMATRLDPASAEAWLWLARTGATRARWRTEGLDAALQATALAPEDPRTWTALAALHLARDARYEAAIAAERAVRVGPDDADAHRMLGTIALSAEEWRHAVTAFRHALQIAPDDVGARSGLVTALDALHIDPSDELDRYGPVPRRPSAVGGRVRQLAQESLDLAAATRMPARRRGVLIGVVVCAAVGALVGLALPGVGLLRGLAASAALVLMWVAIWPLRRRPRDAAGGRTPIPVDDAQDVDERPAPAPARGAAASEPPAARPVPSARSQPDAPSRPAARPASQPAMVRTPQPAQAPTREPATVAGAARPAARSEPPPRRPAPGARPRPQPATVPDATPAKPERPRRLKRPPQDQPAAETAPAGPGASARVDEATSRAEPADAAAEAPADAAAKAPVGPARQKDAPAREDHGAESAPDRAGDHDGLPDDPAQLVALSQARLAEFDLDAARAAAVRLAEVSPDSLDAHRALAAVALAAQDYPQAELHYGKVLEIEPLDEEAHERLAMAKKGRRREERQHRRRRKG